MLLPIDESGHYLCLVCGEDWGDTPPYGEDGGPSFDMCSRCGTEYGYHDGETLHHPGEPLAQRIIRLRVEWLERAGWPAEALAQLQRQLAINEEEARRDAAALPM